MTNETETQEEEKNLPTLGSHRKLWFAKDQTVSFKPWKGLQEAEMSELLNDSEKKLSGGRVCKKVSLMLSYMCVEIAGVKFWNVDDKGRFTEAISLTEREMHISSLHETDALIAFLLMRMACIDSELTMKIPSPYGKDRMCSWSGDLSELTIEGSPSVEESLWDFSLSSPAQVRGKTVNTFTMGPTRWSAAELIQVESPGSLSLKALSGSIHGSPELTGGQGHTVTHFSETDLYDVTKKDLSKMEKGLEENHSGLNLAIEVIDYEEKGPDGKMGRPFVTSLPWMIPSFFEDTSSQ